jgi:phosphatidate cytidylyltransferase
MALGNRSLRILVSVLTIPIILGVIYFGKIPFLLFSLFIGLAASYEVYNLIKQKNSSVNLVPSTLIIIALVSNFYFSFIDFDLLIILSSVVVLTVELFRNSGSAISNIGSTFILIFYVTLFSGTLVGIREYFAYNEFIYNQGGYLLISTFISIWVCDSAAYFIGSAIGKHKLFPRVSPNKSWEGAIAGFIFAVIAMIVLREFIADFLTIIDAVFIGIIIGSIGQIGDLVESLIKRDAGVKDSSNLIPGHGGIFDRFDSLLFVAPVIYIYISIIY